MAVSRRLRFEILRRDSHTCRYCGKSFPPRDLRVDHLMPQSRGGGDDPSNLAAACDLCNVRKHNRTPEEFAAWLTERARVLATTCPLCMAGPGEECRARRATHSWKSAETIRIHPERRGIAA